MGSLFVTKNWRITFQINQAEVEIINLDFEAYHSKVELWHRTFV